MADGSILAPFQPRNHDHGKCVTEAIAAAEARCAEDGQRFTALRRRVLELVWSGHGPVRAYDILDALRDERRGAAPPTVYRALDFLLGLGLIHRIESLNAYVGCGRPQRAHGGQFLICRVCGAVAELDDGGISRAVAKGADEVGFAAEHQMVEVVGLCPRCQAAGKGADRHAS